MKTKVNFKMLTKVVTLSFLIIQISSFGQSKSNDSYEVTSNNPKCALVRYQSVKGDDKFELLMAVPLSTEKIKSTEKSFVFKVYGYVKETGNYKLGLIHTGTIKQINLSESVIDKTVRYDILSGPLKGDVFWIFKGLEAIRIQDADLLYDRDLGDNHLYANFFKEFAPNGSGNYGARTNYRASTLSTKMGSKQ